MNKKGQLYLGMTILSVLFFIIYTSYVIDYNKNQPQFKITHEVCKNETHISTKYCVEAGNLHRSYDFRELRDTYYETYECDVLDRYGIYNSICQNLSIEIQNFTDRVNDLFEKCGKHETKEVCTQEEVEEIKIESHNEEYWSNCCQEYEGRTLCIDVPPKMGVYWSEDSINAERKRKECLNYPKKLITTIPKEDITLELLKAECSCLDDCMYILANDECVRSCKKYKCGSYEVNII